MLRQRFELASMDDLDIGVVFVHAAIAQIDNDLLRRLASVLQQNRGLLQLPVQDMPVVGISGKGSRADDQPAPVGDGNAGLDAELVRLPGFPLPDALDFRGMQGIELVLVFLSFGC